jgi:hypothetical protein
VSASQLTSETTESVMNRLLPIFLCTLLAFSPRADASLTITVSQGEEINLPVLYNNFDLIQGLIATELPGDRGWHASNTNPADQLPAFTDGVGLRQTGLSGLLNDFPPAGEPTKRIEYALLAPADISAVRVFSGNNGRDGRVFHTYTLAFSSDAGQTFNAPVYVQSHFSGTLNNAAFNQWRVALSQVRDDAGPLARRATHIRFDFYAADNSQGECRDPFDGTNPFTFMDDGFSAPITSPLVWEIDVLGYPAIKAVRSGANLLLSWVAESTLVIQASTNLNSLNWADLAPQPAISVNGLTNSATIPIGIGNLFLRLRTSD